MTRQPPLTITITRINWNWRRLKPTITLTITTPARTSTEGNRGDIVRPIITFQEGPPAQ